MRTDIVIDDASMAEALRATGLTTRQEAVEAGLRLLARHAHAADLFGRSSGGAISTPSGVTGMALTAGAG